MPLMSKETSPVNTIGIMLTLSLRSKPDSRVLKDLNFTIHPGQKIGLCGRSGR